MMQKFQFLVLTFQFEAPVLLRAVILLMYSYVGYAENTLFKQLTVSMFFKPIWLFFSLAKETDSVLDSPNPFSIPLKCYSISKV